MEAKDIKTVTAYRIITDEPVAVIVGFKPDNLGDFEYDEFECTDTTEGKGGPDDAIFIMNSSEEDSGKPEVGRMTIMSGQSVGLWLIKPDGKLGDRLYPEPELEVIRHPDQWVAYARMLEFEDEVELKAFHVSTTIAVAEEGITDENIEEYMFDALENFREKFGAGVTTSVVAEIGTVLVEHDKETLEESVDAHSNDISDEMDKALARHNAVTEVERQAEKDEKDEMSDTKELGRTEVNGMAKLIEDIRTLLNEGTRNQIKTQECPKLLDDIANVMRRFGYKVDGGE